MSDRRITRNRRVKIIGGKYNHLYGLTEERCANGNWLVKVSGVLVELPRKYLQPPA